MEIYSPLVAMILEGYESTIFDISYKGVRIVRKFNHPHPIEFLCKRFVRLFRKHGLELTPNEIMVALVKVI